MLAVSGGVVKVQFDELAAPLLNVAPLSLETALWNPPPLLTNLTESPAFIVTDDGVKVRLAFAVTVTVAAPLEPATHNRTRANSFRRVHTNMRFSVGLASKSLTPRIVANHNASG